MYEDRLLIKLMQYQERSSKIRLELQRRVYDAEMRKQENRDHQKN